MSELRTRQNIWTLVGEDPANPWHPVVLAYARAIGVLRDRFDDDPTGWTYQAQIHGLFPDPQDGLPQQVPTLFVVLPAVAPDVPVPLRVDHQVGRRGT